MKQSEQSVDRKDSGQPAHEQTDASPVSATWFMIGLAGLTLAALLGMWGLFAAFTSRQAETPGPTPPVATERRLPPGPRLQVTPEADLEQYRKAEQQVLGSYGWVDKDAGVVRLPIDRAMDLIVERGLPVRSAEAPGGSTPATR